MNRLEYSARHRADDQLADDAELACLSDQDLRERAEETEQDIREMVRCDPDFRSTKLDERIEQRFTPRTATIDDLLRKELSFKQVRAIDMIVAGASDACIAKAIDMHRVTVTRWRLYHPAFIAEISRRREVMLQSNADKLRQLVTKSMAILEERLSDAKNPALQVRAAIALLKLSGTDRACRERGPTSPDDLIEVKAFEKRKREQMGCIDHGELEEVLIDFARRAESAMVEEESSVDPALKGDAEEKEDAEDAERTEEKEEDQKGSFSALSASSQSLRCLSSDVPTEPSSGGLTLESGSSEYLRPGVASRWEFPVVCGRPAVDRAADGVVLQNARTPDLLDILRTDDVSTTLPPLQETMRKDHFDGV